MLTGFGAAPVKTEGAGVQYDNAIESFTARYTHETIAMAFALTEEAVEDNLYDRLAGRYTKAMARSMAHTKQVKGAAVLNNGFDAAFPGGDGVALFSTAHPTALSANFANRPTVGADLNETSLEQGIIDIAAFIDERGLKVALTARKLIVPKELQFTAERLMKSTLRTATADNDINAIKSMGLIPEGYSVNHYLTDVNAWFLITDAPNGLKMFERSPIKTAFEGDFDTGNVRYKARERYSFGWSDPRGAYGSPGA
jgi:phage major head subunit gpT-like protein